jgi:hypothetical protein
MTNRIPLIVDTTDGNKIKELPAGDNLDLTSSAITNATSITTTGTLTAAQVNVNGTNLAAIATTGNYDDLDNTPLLFSGDYQDLTNKPSIPVRTFELFDVLNVPAVQGDVLQWNALNTQWEPTSLAAQVDISEKNLNELQNVIISGDVENKFLKFYAGAWRAANVTYAEVQNTPTSLSDFINDAGFITNATDSQQLTYDGSTLSISNGNSVTLDNINANITTTSIQSTSGNIIITADQNVFINSATGGYVDILNLRGDLRGSVYADDSTILIDGVQGIIPGGNVEGEITANLFGNVSTQTNIGGEIMVDSFNGFIRTHFLEQVGATDGQALVWNDANTRWQPGDVVQTLGLTGTDLSISGGNTVDLSGIVGDTVGNFSFANSIIDTDDSSEITITPAVRIQSDLEVDNSLTVNNDLLVNGNIVTQSTDAPEVFSETEIFLTATTRVEVTQSPFKLASFTDAQRDALTAENGDMIYNTTNNRPEMYVNGAWKIVDTSPIV